MLDENYLLATYRHQKINWQYVAYSRMLDEEGLAWDEHADGRYQLLLQLQYDLQLEDEGLVRFLLQEEIKRHQKEPFQGLFPALKLAIFLLATFEQLEDIPLFYEAIQANFDTLLGLDKEYLLRDWADKVAPFLQENYPEIYEAIPKLIDPEGYTQAELEKWWSGKKDWYPMSETAEPPLALADRYLALEDSEKAAHFVAVWAAQEPESERKRSTLISYYIDLGESDKAIALKKEVVANQKTAWDKVSALTHLSHLCRRANQFDESYESLLEIDQLLSEFDDWKGAGLGLSCAEAALELCLALVGSKLFDRASPIFVLADRWVDQLQQPTLHIIEMGEKTAVALADSVKVERYQQLKAQEKARIRKMMSG